MKNRMREEKEALGRSVWVRFAILFAVLILVVPAYQKASADEPEFTTDFRLEDCYFRTIGSNAYFTLKPGYRLILEGEEEGEQIIVEITVLREKENIYLDGIGRIKTRVIEEREWVDEELVEVSRNFFALCKQTDAVYYFGEDVDIFEYDDEGNLIEITHDGAWRAGVDGALPGLMMPGTFLLGSRYYQEIAPDVALDRGENIATGLTVLTDAGEFHDCVEVLETTPLEPGEESTKIYCPGIGLVVDDALQLTEYDRVSAHYHNDHD